MSSTRVLGGLLTLSFCILAICGCGPQKQESIEPDKSAVVEPQAAAPVAPPQAEVPPPGQTIPAETAPAEPQTPVTVEKQPQPEVEAEKEPQAAKPGAVPIVFRYSVGDVTKYKSTTEDEDGVLFTGKWPKEADFENKRNNTRIDLSYTQQIESVDDAGNAVAKITIDAIRAAYVHKNLPSYDFDNRREADSKKVMYKLLGTSYKIKLAPAGELLEIIDASAAQAVVSGNTPEEQLVAALVTDEAIKQRHGFFTLPQPGENNLAAGDTWRTIKSFSFRMLGTKTYERIYTLTSIEETDGHKIGVLDMKAIPSAEGAEALHQQGQTPDLSQMADNSEEYIGEMRFDLTSGRVQECVERLISKWTVLDNSGQETEPPALVMTAIRVNRVDKLD